MHSVGREWAREHHLTLEGLQKVVPRSNDPGCSAGFGMGLVMELGPQIIKTGGKSALKTCVKLPTRYRDFTCVHSLGHALMRGYHESLFLAVHACSKLGARYAPDCEQGAFHDYWISVRGADDATSPIHAVLSPRKLCAEYPRYAVQCWYRYWIEQTPGPVIEGPPTCCGSAAASSGGSARAASPAPRRMCSTHRSGSWRCARSCARRTRVRACAALRIRRTPASRSGSSRFSAIAGGCRPVRSRRAPRGSDRRSTSSRTGGSSRDGCPLASRGRCAGLAPGARAGGRDRS